MGHGIPTDSIKIDHSFFGNKTVEIQMGSRNTQLLKMNKFSTESYDFYKRSNIVLKSKVFFWLDIFIEHQRRGKLKKLMENL